jgi:hypothetical protein
MEISKVSFNLPIKKLSGELVENRLIQLNSCGDHCLLNNNSFTYAICVNYEIDSFLLITDDNNIIKFRRYKKNEIWNEFGSLYLIDLQKQEEAYKALIEEPIEGILPLKGFCSCSLKVPFLQGELAETLTNPTVLLHYYSYDRKEDWTEGEFWDFAEKSVEVLGELHNKGFIHGDPCGHNIIINEHGLTFIDLDTIMPSTEELLQKRDYDLLFFMCFIPIARKVLHEKEYLYLLSELLSYKEGKIDIAKIKSGEKNSYTFSSWYFDFLYSNVLQLKQQNQDYKSQIYELKTGIMETNRILKSRLAISESDRKERLQVIENLSAINEQIERDRAERLEKLIELTEKYKELEKEAEQRLHIINNFNNEMKVLHMKNSELIQKGNSLSDKIEILNTDLEQKIENEAKLLDENSKLQDELSLLKQTWLYKLLKK